MPLPLDFFLETRLAGLTMNNIDGLFQVMKAIEAAKATIKQQAEKISRRNEVSNVGLDFSVRTATTHTPQFLGLPEGAWAQEGGFKTAGEGVVIGFIDTGIDPTHPSFSDDTPDEPYPPPLLTHSPWCEPKQVDKVNNVTYSFAFEQCVVTSENL